MALTNKITHETCHLQLRLRWNSSSPSPSDQSRIYCIWACAQIRSLFPAKLLCRPVNYSVLCLCRYTSAKESEQVFSTHFRAELSGWLNKKSPQKSSP